MPQGMADIIDHVASLIDVRDRDDLEFTLACVMFELVEASALALWRAHRGYAGPTFELRACLVSDARLAPFPQSRQDEFVGLEALSGEARLAFERRQFSRTIDRRRSVARYAAPVTRDIDVVGLIEIVTTPPLAASRERLISGLIRIYRSHLGILDNNDVDDLTGLSNRRPFNDAFRRLAPLPGALAIARGRPLQTELAVVDVDFFKRVNDTFGHTYGDEVLVLLARLLRENFRETDRVFRFGGEEFVVLLSEADPAGAESALERFRQEVERFVFPQVGQVTVSLGVTSVLDGETGADAFGRADEALYQAKRSGRNRLMRYENLVAEGKIAPRPQRIASIEMF
jgi:diguanylate cyclase (GGDEF)-like protein